MMSCVLCFPWVVMRVWILFGKPFHQLSLISHVVGVNLPRILFFVFLPPSLRHVRNMFAGQSAHPLASAVVLAQEPGEARHEIAAAPGGIFRRVSW